MGMDKNIMYVISFFLGMLIFHLLKGYCGCNNVVEGQGTCVDGTDNTGACGDFDDGDGESCIGDGDGACIYTCPDIELTDGSNILGMRTTPICDNIGVVEHCGDYYQMTDSDGTEHTSACAHNPDERNSGDPASYNPCKVGAACTVQGASGGTPPPTPPPPPPPAQPPPAPPAVTCENKPCNGFPPNSRLRTGIIPDIQKFLDPTCHQQCIDCVNPYIHVDGDTSHEATDLCILRDTCGFTEDNLYHYKELLEEGTGDVDLDCTAASNAGVDISAVMDTSVVTIDLDAPDVAAAKYGCCVAP
jgi:hypothetical protein